MEEIQPPNPSRRTFLKGVCQACGIAAALSVTGLEGCAPAKSVFVAPSNGDKLQIPLSEFGTEKFLVVRTTELPKDLLLLKVGEGFEAHLMECTHRNQPLVLSGDHLYCQAHGSAFSLEGEVLNGPATRPLQQFPAELIGQNVIIHLA